MLCASAAVAHMITADAKMNVFTFRPPTSFRDNVAGTGVFRREKRSKAQTR
jgi:hypothetical protein